MRTLSMPTLGLLFEIAVELFDRGSELPALMMRSDLWQPEYRGEIRQVVLNNLMGARARAEDWDDGQAHRSLLRCAQLIVEKRANHPRGVTQAQMHELREALLADGYELTWEPASLLPDEYTARCAILPTDAAPVPLAAEISALDAELTARGYATVLNLYRQAVDNFSSHKYESSNGALRTALEDLVTRLAEDNGFVRLAGPNPGQPRANQGTPAIAHLVGSGSLPESEGGKFLSGLWSMIHTNGPHPGQSDADEARFRMQVVTAAARFLLKRFPAQP